MTIDRITGRITIEPIPEGVDVHEYMKQVIHDCPECRAERERVVEPIMLDPETDFDGAFTSSPPRDDRETRQVRRARRRRERKARKRSRSR